jgi:hypothetical protein
MAVAYADGHITFQEPIGSKFQCDQQEYIYPTEVDMVLLPRVNERPNTPYMIAVLDSSR